MRYPGGRFAMSVIHPGSPALQIRYREGVLVNPFGFPEWALCARAVIELPPPEPGLTRDEVRVVDVLTGNLAAAWVGDDPLWSGEGTPAGWCWAHVGRTRLLALVPIELHGAYRHAGGITTLEVTGRGLRTGTSPVPVALTPPDPVPDDLLDLLERLLGWPLPEAYRRYLAATNGAGPAAPGVLPGHGFVADQPLFGLARADRQQDISYVVEWARDRLTVDFLPIGYVQGGLLAVRVSGGDLDSIWYWDDDDPRARDEHDPEYICANLLHRCADTIDDFFAALVRPADDLVRVATARVDNGQVRHVRDAEVGAGLPVRQRAPWQRPPPAVRDPLTTMFEVR
jgi:hypothetical protein